MPIVLAIEPDRHQAAHLTAIVRHQVGAELVLAHTTEGALDAIGNRVPDLVLVPALLSPQDDAALAAALRVIAAAAHVRTLTIPVLSHGTKREAARGMLAKWRRSREASPEPDGCEPAVFGEQIVTYLREAAADRAQLEEDAALGIEQPAPIVEPTAITASAPVVEAVAIAEPAPIEDAAPIDDATETPTLNSDFEPRQHTPTSNSETALQPLQRWASDPVEETATEPEEVLVDLSDELDGLEDEEHGGPADGELFDGEPVGVYTISEDAIEPDIDAFDLLPAILEPPAEQQAPLFAEAAEAPRADIIPWEPMYLSPGRMWPPLEGMPAEVPAPRAEQPDWIELVASLRQDLERRRTEPALAAADPIAARPSDGARAEALVKKPRPAAKKAKPVQDEWGFFDPEQCGFSTLLAKLDEITEEDVRP
jgi:hypothetical protein